MTQTYYVVVNAQGHFRNFHHNEWVSDLRQASFLHHKSTAEQWAFYHEGKAHTVTMTLGPELT